MYDLETAVGLLARDNAALKATLRSIYHCIDAAQVSGLEPRSSAPSSQVLLVMEEILDILRWHLSEKKPEDDSEAESRLRELLKNFDQQDQDQNEKHECGCGGCHEGKEKTE